MARDFDLIMLGEQENKRCVIATFPAADVDFVLTDNDFGISIRADELFEVGKLPSNGTEYIGELFIKNGEIYFDAFDNLFYTLEESTKAGDIDKKYFKSATEFVFANGRDSLGTELRIKRSPEGYCLYLTKPIEKDDVLKNVFDSEPGSIKVDIETTFDNYETRNIYNAFKGLFDKLGAIKGETIEAPGYEIRKIKQGN